MCAANHKTFSLGSIYKIIHGLIGLRRHISGWYILIFYKLVIEQLWLVCFGRFTVILLCIALLSGSLLSILNHSIVVISVLHFSGWLSWNTSVHHLKNVNLCANINTSNSLLSCENSLWRLSCDSSLMFYYK